jgi:TRAP-type C4-dicarboxylate transport system permease small subunit
MRRFLDALYFYAGVAAAVSLFLIFALVTIQLCARMLDGLMRLAGQPALGFIIPSITEICGFLLAAASFLALAHTLMVGGHIRVSLVLSRLGSAARRYVETFVALLAAAGAGYATVALAKLAWRSWQFGDVSYGIVPIPLALPQALMTLGVAVLAIALLDLSVRAWRDRTYVQGGPEA